ncbi:MAG: hypothetical protein Q7T72_02650 [Bacteroidales bacterium]|nr:hypothetical protein [Bacteroidales bacterium]MDO9339407.1 hypothetical protein [Bacteroidales bacterium]
MESKADYWLFVILIFVMLFLFLSGIIPELWHHLKNKRKTLISLSKEDQKAIRKEYKKMYGQNLKLLLKGFFHLK